MIRHTFLAGLAAGILWASAHPARSADDPKTPAPMGGISPQTQKINEFILKGYEAAGIKTPSKRANDHEFMRRVFIDLIGRIPTAEEIVDFEKDQPAATKRVRLVQRLLNEKKYSPKPSPNAKPFAEVGGLKKVPIDYSAAYASNFAEIWSVWLLTRSGVDEIYREQFMMWLEEKLDSNVPYRDFVTELITATGKSNENGAVHFVFRHIGDPLAGDLKGSLDRDGKYDNVPITSRVTKMFLGIQTQCTQCHNHPQAKEWLQVDFWGVNAFFRQTEKRGQQTSMNKKAGVGVGNAVELTDMPGWNKETSVFYDQRDGQRKAVYATMLKNVAEAEKLEKSKKVLASAPGANTKSRRQVLAEWVLQHDNFEKAYVNRMWGHLFGRGLHKEPTVDDFKSDNEIVHPELMQYLAEQFKQYNHDSKKLLEWICTSDVYQLSHVAVKDLTDVKYDPYFARMPLKAQSPEAIFESLSIATRARTRLSEDAYKALKRTWSNRLVRNFGDDEGNESNFNGTIVQALLMMNGKDLNDQIKSTKTSGLVADVVNKHLKTGTTPANVRGIYEELFLMTLSRRPTTDEIAKLEQVRNGQARINLGTMPTTPTVPPKGKGPVVPPPKTVPGGGVIVAGAQPNDVTFYEDVFWALLNTNEFMLNH